MTRRRCALQLMAVLCLANPALGQTAAITGPESAAVGAPILLDLAGSEGERIRIVGKGPDGRSVAVAPLHGPPPESPLLYGMASTPAEGRYLFVLVAITGESEAVDFAEVRVGEATPGPTPDDPDPIPPVGPMPGVEPTRAETERLLAAAQAYGAAHADPLSLAYAAAFFGREVQASSSSPLPDSAWNWLGEKALLYGGRVRGPVAESLEKALSDAMRPAYRPSPDGKSWSIADREYLAECLLVLSRGLYLGGIDR